MVDVAGLIRGAHEGKGLGNQFLDDLRGVDALVHVIRCFKDSKIVHVENDGLSLDPVEDRAIIRSELLLADMQLLERRKENLSSKHVNNLWNDLFGLLCLRMPRKEDRTNSLFLERLSCLVDCWSKKWK
jgi:ribosome-binding ATPase YchF (GTP1/OBG family)